jgi:16S rRNA (adenine1518-N6/adenine1519-N6)-dimethyltransferase
MSIVKLKKSLGQHFLSDSNIIAKIIRFSDIKETDEVVEIGPGGGALSVFLARRAKRLVCVELDSRMCVALKEKFKDLNNVEIINEDILKFDFSPFNNLKIVGSLPYYITTPIINYLIKNRKHILEINLIIQKEVGQRLLAKPHTKDYGSFCCFVNYFTRPEILFFIKNTCFHPAPKVDSVFVKLEVLSTPSVEVGKEDVFLKIIRTAFSQRRKTLVNNLKDLASKEKLQYFIAQKGFKEGVRSQELSLKDFADLSLYVQDLPCGF